MTEKNKGRIHYRVVNVVLDSIQDGHNEDFSRLLDKYDREGWLVEILAPVVTGNVILYTIILKKPKKTANKTAAQPFSRTLGKDIPDGTGGRTQ